MDGYVCFAPVVSVTAFWQSFPHSTFYLHSLKPSSSAEFYRPMDSGHTAESEVHLAGSRLMLFSPRICHENLKLPLTLFTSAPSQVLLGASSSSLTIPS